MHVALSADAPGAAVVPAALGGVPAVLWVQQPACSGSALAGENDVPSTDEGVRVTLSTTARHTAEQLLTERYGARVRVAAVSDFPHAQVTRCSLEAVSSGVPATVIVRVPRADPARSGLARLHNEHAALVFLRTVGSSLAPRYIASDATAEMLITEDLGADPSLLELLLGHDPLAARRGLFAFARGLGTLHAQTVGQAAAYAEQRAALGPADLDGAGAAVRMHVMEQWQQVQDAVARLELPRPRGVDQDIAEVVQRLALPGPYLALSNGDPSPVNCTITGDSVRFFDFESAIFRHALLDASVLRYLYPTGAPPWRLPHGLAGAIEREYRAAIGPACPGALDDDDFDAGMAAASAAWTILRLVRLPRVAAGPDRDPWLLVPSGWSAPLPARSRRRQLVAIIDTCIASAHRAHSFDTLAAWCVRLCEALHTRWPEAREELPLYPALQ